MVSTPLNKLLFIFCFFIFSIACTVAKKSKKTCFSKQNAAIIMSSTKPMRVLKITNKTDSILLRAKSHYVKPNSKNKILNQFINRLYTTVTDSTTLGVGIAAPQVGILKNIIWVQRLDKENIPFEVYLNPKIIKYSKKTQTVREGCLSIPNRSAVLNSRSEQIKIEYDTMKGIHKSEVIEGFTAVIFQHEIDHLNGILYLDHLTTTAKNLNY